MDEADLTTERMEKEAELRRRLVFENELEATGTCHWCGEPVTSLRKFCSVDCSFDWEYDKKRRKQNV